jgi:hypothetical protein
VFPWKVEIGTEEAVDVQGSPLSGDNADPETDRVRSRVWSSDWRDS